MSILKLKEALKGEGVFYAAVIWEDTDTIRIASDSHPLPVKVMAGGTSGAQYTEGDTTSPAIGTLSLFRRSSDGKLYAAELDDNNVLKVNVVAGGAGGGVAQTQVRDASNNWVDVGYYSGNLNMPVEVRNTVTVQATDLDIRDLNETTDKVTVFGSEGVALAQKTGTNALIITLNGEKIDINDISAGVQTNDVKVTLDGEKVVLGAGSDDIGNVKLGGTSLTITHHTGDYSTAQTDTVLWTPASGKRFVITSIYISSDTAMTITLKDGSTVIRKLYVDAKGGLVDNLGFAGQIVSSAADNSLTITTSADGNVFIDVAGYEI